MTNDQNIGELLLRETRMEYRHVMECVDRINIILDEHPPVLGKLTNGVELTRKLAESRKSVRAVADALMMPSN